MRAGPNLFPLGIATGDAHCNRTEERAELRHNIGAGAHTWLWGRRRMGKTSLVEQVLQDLAGGAIASATVDLLVAHDAEDLEGRLRAAVEEVSARMAPNGRKASEKLGDAFRALAPEFSFDAMGLKLRLSPPAPPARGIMEMLLGLDRAAGAVQRRVVMVLDEFQQLAQLSPRTAPRSLEGAIRHAVERSANVTYLFSGSQKHLLAAMFEEEERPLYRLCRKMTLDRIGEADYQAFIRRASETRWRRAATDGAIGRVLRLTARHPYYVNALCARLWGARRPPTPESVDAQWSRIVEEEGRIAAGRVIRLSPSQRAVLRAIAHMDGGVEHPGSYRFLSALRLPTSTGNQAREVLEREDLIRQEDDGRWTLVDPVVSAYLRRL